MKLIQISSDCQEATNYRASAENYLRNRTSKFFGAHPDEVIIRQLLPSDIGLKQWQFVSRAKEETCFVKYLLASSAVLEFRKVIIIYKIVIDPREDKKLGIVKLRRGVGGPTTLGIIDISPLYLPVGVRKKEGSELAEYTYLPQAYLDNPVVYDPSEVIDIVVEALSAGTYTLMLEGYVGEAQSYVGEAL